MKRWFLKLLGRRDEPDHLKTGRWGERQAMQLLKKKGFKILGERIRVGKRDEIDIVAEDGPALIFIEVKTRGDETYGRPFTAVTSAKRKNLSRAAVAYIRKKKVQPEHIRFDVVEVIGHPGDAEPERRHIENAFSLDPAYRLWW